MSQSVSDAYVHQNVTSGGDEPIMLNVVQPDGKTRFILCVHIGKKIELFNAATQRAVWVANLASLCG